MPPPAAPGRVTRYVLACGLRAARLPRVSGSAPCSLTLTNQTAPSQTESLSFELELQHPPQKVWRALTDPVLLADGLLPVVEGKLGPGAAFTFKTQPQPGWDGTVSCRMREIEAQKKLSYTWVVGDTTTSGWTPS